MRTINNILAFVLTLGAPMAIAQQRAARTPPRPAPQASAVLTFDDNTKALPSNYSGDSFSQAFSRYSATATTKGEFETSAEFEARRNAAPNIPASVETYSFQIIPNDVSLTITYLADIRQFDVHLFETQGVYTIRGREPWPRRIVLNQRDLNRGSSIRQNAFGASIRVTQIARIVTSLALTNP